MKQQTISRLSAVLKELVALNPEMNLNMVLTLLEVSKGQGVTGRDIESAIDSSPTTAARMLRVFDKVQSNGKPGFDLVEARIDPLDYRAKLRYLNKDGELLLKKLDDLLHGR